MKTMSIERIMRFLFSQQLFYQTVRRYDLDIERDDKQLCCWYHDGFKLLSDIRKGLLS